VSITTCCVFTISDKRHASRAHCSLVIVVITSLVIATRHRCCQRSHRHRPAVLVIAFRVAAVIVCVITGRSNGIATAEERSLINQLINSCSGSVARAPSPCAV
jgi:hypothetical protein